MIPASLHELLCWGIKAEGNAVVCLGPCFLMLKLELGPLGDQMVQPL